MNYSQFFRLRPLTILPRRDTEEEWEKKNPVLKQVEICVVYTKKGAKYKLGNGESTYKELPFTTLEDVIENGVMYSSNRMARIRGFTKEWHKSNENP